MSGRGKRPWKEPKEPVPPGLVSQSLQGVAPDPPAAAAASVGPGSSAALAATVPTHWKKKRDGKKKLARTIDFRRKQQDSRWQEGINVCPWISTSLMNIEEWSPLTKFRNGQIWELCRIAMFVLQMLLNLVQMYTVSPDLQEYWGEGQKTAPRYALLFHHETNIEGNWKTKLGTKRNFFMRAVREGADLKVFSHDDTKDGPPEQWKTDALISCRDAVQLKMAESGVDWVLTGFLPALDLSVKPLHEAYGTTAWQVVFKMRVNVFCIRGRSTVKLGIYFVLL